MIFNTTYWDRSINALWKCITSESCDWNWRGFKLPEDFLALTNFVTEKSEDISSLTLLGSFRNWDSINANVTDTLKDIFVNSKVPRVWLMIFDLHHSINDLLLGTKTIVRLNNDDVSSVQMDPTIFFDVLAWGYEQVKFAEDLDASLFENRVQFLKAKKTLRLAKETWSSLRKYFPNRLPFYHCLDMEDFSKFRLKNLLTFYYIGIPGTLYETRRKVRDYFLGLGYSVTPSDQLSKLFDKFVAIYLRLTKVRQMEKEDIIKFKRKVSYMKLSKVCQLSSRVWVDGSYLSYPVRKYFEIPALNGLLVSPKNASIQALNIFEDWQFTTPELLSNSTSKSRMLKGLEKKRIVEQQKSQLLRHHTAKVRLQFLATYIDHYQPNFSTRAYYKEGQLVLERNGKLLNKFR